MIIRYYYHTKALNHVQGTAVIGISSLFLNPTMAWVERFSPAESLQRQGSGHSRVWQSPQFQSKDREVPTR